MTRPFTFAAALALALGAATSGQAQTIVTDNTTPYNASPSLTSFQTDFDEVGGMLVDWTFFGGGTGSGTWGDLGGGNWGVSDAGFRLSGTGSNDTFGGLWTLTGENITSFTLRAAPGRGVFDIVGSPDISPGSASGWPFDYSCAGLNGCNAFFFVLNGDLWNTTVTYSNPVGINGADPLGDLYATMNVSFGSTFNRGSDRNCYNFVLITASSGCNYVRFYQDMDNVPRDGGTVTPQNVVPEPATMTLLATGLAGMAAARRRRKQSK